MPHGVRSDSISRRWPRRSWLQSAPADTAVRWRPALLQRGSPPLQGDSVEQNHGLQGCQEEARREGKTRPRKSRTEGGTQGCASGGKKGDAQSAPRRRQASRESSRRQAQRQAAWQPGLIGPDGQPTFGLKFYVLGLDGGAAGVTLRGGGQYACSDPEQGPRLEELVPALE